MTLYLALIIMTMVGAVASLSLKNACSSPDFFAIVKSAWLYAGGFLYLGSAIINIILLKYLDYSIVLPFTSLTYVWSTILSARILKESVSRKQIAGLAFIVAGAFLLIIP